jgi:cytoskeletal protein RodZ
MQNGPKPKNQISEPDEKQRMDGYKALALLVLVLIFLVGLAMSWWADFINDIVRTI